MGFLDSVKAMFSESTKSLEDEVDRRQTELDATPEQRMELLQDKIDENDSAFDEIQSKIDRKGAVALATADLDEQQVMVPQADNRDTEAISANDVADSNASGETAEVILVDDEQE